jgi:hypothetical protein
MLLTLKALLVVLLLCLACMHHQRRYEDNFDAVNNLTIISQNADKGSIDGYGSPEQFLDKISYLFGKQTFTGANGMNCSVVYPGLSPVCLLGLQCFVQSHPAVSLGLSVDQQISCRLLHRYHSGLKHGIWLPIAVCCISGDRAEVELPWVWIVAPQYILHVIKARAYVKCRGWCGSAGLPACCSSAASSHQLLQQSPKEA